MCKEEENGQQGSAIFFDRGMVITCGPIKTRLGVVRKWMYLECASGNGDVLGGYVSLKIAR